MKKVMLCFLITFALPLPTLADIEKERPSASIQSPAAAEVGYGIDVAEWTFRHSSMANILSASVVDNSIEQLSRARAQLAQGNLLAAEKLLDSASRPLAQMGPAALAGKHPNPLQYKADIRQTLVSIIDAAEKIVAEEKTSGVFVAEARKSLERSDRLLAAGSASEAREQLILAYSDVQKNLAQLRSGKAFYIETPKSSTPESWEDGLRRMDERRYLTRYIVLEAQAEGVDIAQLQTEVAAAEAIFATAQDMARDKRWDQALQALDMVYARYEASWRSVGIEW